MHDPLDVFPEYEFKPLVAADDLLRYDDGKWTPSTNQEYDMAFMIPSQCLTVGVHLPFYSNERWAWCRDIHERIEDHPCGYAWHIQLAAGETRKGRSGYAWNRINHPNTIAYMDGIYRIDKLCHQVKELRVQFYIQDTHMQAGMVRERATKKLVIPPRIISCMYCGLIDTQSAKEV